MTTLALSLALAAPPAAPTAATPAPAATAAPAAAGQGPRPAPRDAESRARAAAVLDAALAAAGGAEAWAKVKDFRLTGKEARGHSPKLWADREVLWRRRPDGLQQFKETLRVHQPRTIELSHTWNGRQAFRFDDGTVEDDSTAELDLGILTSLRIDVLHGQVKEGKAEAWYWGERDEDGRRLDVIEVQRPRSQVPIHYSFDRQTRFLRKLKFLASNDERLGNEFTVVWLADHRPVEGLVFPFHLKQVQQNRFLDALTYDRRLDKVELNVGIADAAFARPKRSLPPTGEQRRVGAMKPVATPTPEAGAAGASPEPAATPGASPAVDAP